MVLERREELEVVENEQRVESVQHRFPNDNLQLHDAPTTLTAQPVTVSQLTTRTVQLAVTVSQACCTFAIPVIANIASGYRRKLTQGYFEMDKSKGFQPRATKFACHESLASIHYTP